jgi:uncharacterized membrane protein
MIFTKENMMISLLYVATLLLAIYSSLFWGTYLSSIIVVLLQVRNFLYKDSNWKLILSDCVGFLIMLVCYVNIRRWRIGISSILITCFRLNG